MIRRESLFLCVAAAGVLLACGATGASGGSRADQVPSSRPVRLASPPGVDLVAACTPTGPEICFNAVDDNCNGVIEEGCGLRTGALQFVIAWGPPQADVDVAVVTPSGERVDGHHRLAGALRLERECPSDGCDGQNIENMVLDGLEAPRGKYLIEVSLRALGGAPLPITVRFGARAGGYTHGAELVFREPGERLSFDLEL